MQPDEKIPVKVQIANKLLPLKVARSDEEIIRLAARMLNQRMDTYKTYDSSDSMEKLAWAALGFTGELIRHLRNNDAHSSAVEKELQRLEEHLQPY